MKNDICWGAPLEILKYSNEFFELFIYAAALGEVIADVYSKVFHDCGEFQNFIVTIRPYTT